MMARSTCKITVLFMWIVLVREVLTQGQTLPDTATPEVQNMMLGTNQESENDAIEMGRNAAEDMGALMASPPMNIYRPPQTSTDSFQNEDSGSEYSSYYTNAREAGISSCQRYNNAQGYSDAGQPSAGFWDSPQSRQWSIYLEQPSGRFVGSLQDADIPQYAQWYPSSQQPSERSAVPRTIPLAPLPPLPLIPGLSPLPMLSPLIQSLTNPGRLGLGFGPRPLLRTPQPLATPLAMPALRLPFTLPALRSSSQTYQLPKMNRVWIPPTLRKARSSFTPSSYARNPNQYKPLVFYV